MPETAYHRQGSRTTPGCEQRKIVIKENEKHAKYIETTVRETSVPPNISYAQPLRIDTGRDARAPLCKIFVRPRIVFWYPAGFWASLIYGVSRTWIIVCSLVNTSIFPAPPYNFSVSQTGLISSSPFILIISGELISGPLNACISLKLAERNRGIYEPEFRLVLTVPVSLPGVCGFFGFGARVAAQMHWSRLVLTCGPANTALAFA